MGAGDGVIAIDGAQGEGGGQILRTSLALAIRTGRPVRLTNLRANRTPPGLRPQHLAAVRAAAAVGDAEVDGAAVGADTITFTPRGLVPGEHVFRVATAGSAALVLQTVLPALLDAPAPSRLVLEGGTHNAMAPPWEFLAETFLPLVSRMGPRVTTTLERRGFYPKGGGRFVVEVTPAPLRPTSWLDRGPIRHVQARAIVSHLPDDVARRELKVVGEKLGGRVDGRVVRDDGLGPGNAIVVGFSLDTHTLIFTAVGERGVRAEVVAARVVGEARRWRDADVPVDEHLADQLLLPLAIAGGGAFRTTRPSSHATTNAAVIGRFMPAPIAMSEQDDGAFLVTVGDAAADRPVTP